MSGASGKLETRWSVTDIQRAVVRHTHNDTSIPNVSFGFFKGIECDLVQVTSACYLHEFEIKRSWADFMADFKKKKFHDDVRIAQLTFVLPESFAGERLRKFCAERHKEFKRYFDFMFYMEDGDYCHIAAAVPVAVNSWRVTYKPEERFRTETYITDEMARVIQANDVAAPYRRKLFIEELANLYRLGVIRLWHRPSEPDTEDSNKKEAKMKATVDGIVYEGTEAEIRRIVENPPHRPPAAINHGPTIQGPSVVPPDYQRNWDGSPRILCEAGAATSSMAGEDPK